MAELDLSQNIIALQQELDGLKRRFDLKERRQLSYPLDSDSVFLLKDKIREETPSLFWNRYFYLFENPVVIDASTLLGTWSMTTSGGSFSGDRSRVVLKTGTSADNYSAIIKRLNTQGIIRFDKQQEFRTAFSIDILNNVSAYLVRGDKGNSENKYFGFKLVDSVLYGVAKNSSTEQTVSLGYTITANTTYDLVCKYDPSSGLIFLVQSIEDGTVLAKATLTDNYPTGATANFFSVYIYTSDTTEKSLSFSYVEYFQLR